MYSLTYKVTTSTCDSEGKLKLYSALQMMQDCSEMWIDSEPEVKDYFLQQNMALESSLTIPKESLMVIFFDTIAKVVGS